MIVIESLPKALMEFIKSGEHINSMIYLNLPYKTLLTRVENRLVCSNPLCQATYNRNTAILDNGIYYCRHCHSILTVRIDDNPYAIRKRYDIFQKNLDGIIEFCHTYDIPFIEIDADKNPFSPVASNKTDAMHPSANSGGAIKS